MSGGDMGVTNAQGAAGIGLSSENEVGGRERDDIQVQWAECHRLEVFLQPCVGRHGETMHVT